MRMGLDSLALLVGGGLGLPLSHQSSYSRPGCTIHTLHFAVLVHALLENCIVML
jgi:hypothetical protein